MKNDTIRIARGLRKVADFAIQRNGPDFQVFIQSVLQHTEGLIHSVGTFVKEEKYKEHVSVREHVTTPTPARQEVVEEDIIGFDSIREDSVAVEVKTNSSSLMREQPVPSSQLGRLAGFGSLAVRMAFGEIYSRASTTIYGDSGSKISEENAERLAEALCRMRGAALKLGQMLSLQDDASLPPALRKALDRVKHAADYMPKSQLEKQLIEELGPHWRSRFLDFDEKPIAAASIGQVHRAKLHDGANVVVKIQYPGVAESIHSDLQNLKSLISLTNFLPPGLFLDNIIKVAGTELTEECMFNLSFYIL